MSNNPTTSVGPSNLGSFDSLKRDFVRKVKQVGFWAAITHGCRKIVRNFTSPGADPGSGVDAFDRKYGTDTSLIVSVGALDIPDEKLDVTNRYEAVMVEVFGEILEGLPKDVENFTFIDIGAGKGRSLLLASHLPFKEIIGVEISQMLHEIAVKNIGIYKDGGQKCTKMRSVCSDATTYQLPPGPLVLYLNNPFPQQVMTPVLAGIEKALEAEPRRMAVVYQRPLCRQLWDGSKHFRLIKDSRFYVIYEAV